jgi:transcription initiation factor TFIIB
MRCPECGSTKIKGNTLEEQTCQDCGLVIEEYGPHNSYIPSNRQELAHTPLRIMAGGHGVDGRIYKAHWLLSTKEKNVNAAHKSIDILAQKLRMPPRAVEEAKILYTMAAERDLLVGRDIPGIVAACIYTACVSHGIPKIPLEVAMHTHLKPHELVRLVRLLKRKLRMKFEPLVPSDLVHRFGLQLGLTQETIVRACDIIETCSPEMRACQPQTLVATALYLAAQQNGERLTQWHLAHRIGVIEVTIRKRKREMEKLLGQVVI